MLLEIESEKAIKPIRNSKLELDETKVYLLFDIESEAIYLSAGKNTPVSLRFFGSKLATHYGKELNFEHFLVSRLEDQEIFEQAIDRYKKWAKSKKKLPKILKNLNISASNVSTKKITKKVAKSVQIPESESFTQIMGKLLTLEAIDGRTLDYVIIPPIIYAVTGEIPDYSYKKLENIPDGIVDIENYTPRMYTEDSKLIAIEFWRNID